MIALFRDCVDNVMKWSKKRPRELVSSARADENCDIDSQVCSNRCTMTGCYFGTAADSNLCVVHRARVWWTVSPKFLLKILIFHFGHEYSRMSSSRWAAVGRIPLENDNHSKPQTGANPMQIAVAMKNSQRRRNACRTATGMSCVRFFGFVICLCLRNILSRQRCRQNCISHDFEHSMAERGAYKYYCSSGIAVAASLRMISFDDVVPIHDRLDFEVGFHFQCLNYRDRA